MHSPEGTTEHEAADAGSLAGWVGGINRYLDLCLLPFPKLNEMLEVPEGNVKLLC